MEHISTKTWQLAYTFHFNVNNKLAAPLAHISDARFSLSTPLLQLVDQNCRFMCKTRFIHLPGHFTLFLCRTEMCFASTDQVNRDQRR